MSAHRSSRYLLAALAPCCLLASACRAPVEEGPALATSTRALTEVEVATLPNGASMAELQQSFGPGEDQSGQRLLYRAAKEPGKYFWVYPYTAAAGTMVHHIVLADRMEEEGKIIWPAKWTDMSPASAAYIREKSQSR